MNTDKETNDLVQNKCLANLKLKEDVISLIEDIAKENPLTRKTESVLDLLNEKQKIQAEISSLKSKMKNLKEEFESLESVGGNLDSDKYFLQLYEQITNLKFKINCLPDEIVGYTTEPLRTFCLNTKEHTPYYIAEFLWGFISEKKQFLNESGSEILSDAEETLDIGDEESVFSKLKKLQINEDF